MSMLQPTGNEGSTNEEHETPLFTYSDRAIGEQSHSRWVGWRQHSQATVEGGGCQGCLGARGSLSQGLPCAPASRLVIPVLGINPKEITPTVHRCPALSYSRVVFNWSITELATYRTIKVTLTASIQRSKMKYSLDDHISLKKKKKNQHKEGEKCKR